MSNLLDVVGLFGTCGDSTWRDSVMQQLEAAGIGYFNPVVDEWNDEAQAAELRHATSDKVILLNITGETEGIGSLSESGWLAFLANNRGQNVVVVLEDMPANDDNKHNNKARKLVRGYGQKVAEAGIGGVYFFESLDDAMPTVLQLMAN